MKILKVEQNSLEWLELRKGRITGSKLGDIYAARGGRKVGFYQLIADRLAIVEDTDEAPHDRGHRLEEEALELASAELGFTLEKCEEMWVSDLDENIAISPDGANKKRTKSGEVKALKAALHLQAVIEEKTVKRTYQSQALQYFVVNEKLTDHYGIFYNPLVTAKPLYIIHYKRADYEDDIKFWQDYEQQVLKDVEKYVEELAF